MLIERGEFPEWVDSTWRRDFSSCPLKAYFGSVKKIEPNTSNVHLFFGGCFARGLEITRKAYYGEECSIDDAIFRGGIAIVEQWGDFVIPDNAAPSAKKKTLEACLLAHRTYFEQYPLNHDSIKPHMIDGTPSVEFSFAVPLHGTAHPLTGKPIIYVGRFDMLAEAAPNALFVDDEKTASQIGDHWIASWELASQMTGYIWACQQYEYPVQGAYIRGVAIGKDAISHVQVVIQRSKWEIDRWHKQLVRDVNRFRAMWEEGYFDMALDDACNSYGGCAYRLLCTSPPENVAKWIGTDYKTREWNPIQLDDAA